MNPTEALTRTRAEHGGRRHPRDRGSTFIEMLVSIVLLGTTVIAVLVALQATTVASRIDADTARASTWLHDASDAVFEMPRTPCALWDGVGDQALPASYIDQRATVLADIQAEVAAVPAPSGWSAASISVTKVEFLAQVAPDSPVFTWSNDCYEGVQPDADADGDDEDYRDQPLLSQKVTIRVDGPDDRVSKILETVKGDR